MDSVDIVHGPRSNTPAGQCPWTVFTESVDFLQMGIASIFLCVSCQNKIFCNVFLM